MKLHTAYWIEHVKAVWRLHIVVRTCGTIRDAGWVLSTTLESHAKHVTLWRHSSNVNGDMAL